MAEQEPIIVKRRWFRDPDQTEEPIVQGDAEAMAAACEERSIEDAELGLSESSEAWRHQGGNALELDTEVRGGSRNIPAMAVDVYQQVRQARPDLDVYIEPEPLKVHQPDSEIAQQGEGSTPSQWQQWAVVADHPETDQTARLEFHTQRHDTLLTAVQAHAGEVEQFNWRDYQPWRDISVDPENPPRQLLGEDVEEGWPELRRHYVEDLVASIPETRDPQTGALVVHAEGPRCGIDPDKPVDYDDEPDHDAAVQAEVALQQQRHVAGADGPSL